MSSARAAGSLAVAGLFSILTLTTACAGRVSELSTSESLVRGHAESLDGTALGTSNASELPYDVDETPTIPDESELPPHHKIVVLDALAAPVRARSQGNYVVSPLTTRRALAGAMLAASGAARTRIADALWLPSDGEELAAELRQERDALMNRASPIVIGDGGFVREDVRLDETFRVEHERAFGSFVSFARTGDVTPLVRDWLARATLGEATISEPTDGLPSSGQQPTFVTTHSLFMRAPWAFPFDVAATWPAPFALSKLGRRTAGVPTRDVPMMHNDARYFYARTSYATLLGIAFRGTDTIMVLAVPVGISLEDLERRVVDESLVLRTLQREAAMRVIVEIPKFHVDSSMSLGLTDFEDVLGDDAASASLCRYDASDVHSSLRAPSSIVERASLDVDEHGAVAVAVTDGRVIAPPGPRPKRRVFRADQPFLFYILDYPSRSFVLVGRVTDPIAPARSTAGR